MSYSFILYHNISNDNHKYIDSMDSSKKPVSPLTSSKFIFEGLIPRDFEYINTIMFILSINNINSNIYSTFNDYPYCLIESIEITDNKNPMCKFSGSLLWCLIQTLPSPEKENHLLAAKQGIICLKQVLPFLYYAIWSQLEWKIIIKESIFNLILSKYHDQINSLLSTMELYNNITHNIIQKYIKTTPQINMKINIEHVMIDIERRDALITKECNFPFTDFIYFDLSHDCEKSLVVNLTKFKFNWLIGNPDQPGIFYDPYCKPMLKIIIKENDIEKTFNHNDCYIVDKSTHGIHCPESIAYYTRTFQKFNVDEKSSTSFTIKVILNQHIPKHAPIYFWIDYTNKLINKQGFLFKEKY